MSDDGFQVVLNKIIDMIFRSLDACSQARFAVCCTFLYDLTSNSKYVWWRIREVYVNSDEYSNDRLNEEKNWWNDFIVERLKYPWRRFERNGWPRICFHTMIVRASLSDECVDDEMLHCGISLKKKNNCGFYHHLGKDTARHVMRLGRVDLVKDICDKYGLAKYKDCNSWEQYVLNNLIDLIPRDHVDEFKKYFTQVIVNDKCPDSYWHTMLSYSLKCGSPKIATLILYQVVANKLLGYGADKHIKCLCDFISSYQGLFIVHERDDFNCNKHDELPDIICPFHEKVLLVGFGERFIKSS